MIIFVNNQFEKEENAKISVFDLGLVRGFGAFAFMRTYSGKPFHFKDHIKRFFHSLDQLGIKLPISQTEIRNIIYLLMKMNALKEADIKLIATGGASLDGIMPDQNPSFIVSTTKVSTFPDAYYEKGIKIISHPGKRFLPTCKSLDYCQAILMLQKARKQGAFEALYIDDQNRILEATTCNFFAFTGDTLITPKSDILEGITKEVVLKITKNQFKQEIRDVNISEITSFDEVFLTSSKKEILPVRQLDSVSYFKRKNTLQVMKLFKDYTKRSTWEDLNLNFSPKTSTCV